MTKRSPPTQETFDKLLLWLNPDRDKAAEKYERIQYRLIKIFAAWGYFDAEDLADETINVVTAKIDWLIGNYVGDPALYFFGVAKKIYLERLKQKPPPPEPPKRDPPPEELEQILECLDKCKEELPEKDRNLLEGYHPEENKGKITKRKELAAKLGVTSNALRIRVCNIHSRLRVCIGHCLSNSQT